MSRRTRLWTRFLRTLLFFYPRRFRRTYGDALVADYQPAPRRRVLATIAATTWDLMRAGLGARLDDRRRRRAAAGRTGRTPVADRLRTDLRLARRSLAANPAFTSAAVVTLGLAAGLNAAVFGIFDATLLRPLPYPAASRIVSIGSTWTDLSHASVSIAEFLDYRERATAFASLTAMRKVSVNLADGAGAPERVQGARVTASFFDVLGVEPIAGRRFAEAEDRPGQDGVALVGEGLWIRRFARDPDLVGRTIRLDGEPIVVVGVLPATVALPGLDVEIWRPLAIDPARPGSRGAHNRLVLARLAPGATLEGARSQMDAIARQLAAEYPDSYPGGSGWGVSVLPLRARLVGNLEAPLALLFVAVIFVLIIASANVANLMLVRALDREREFAMRAALGASRARLLAQTLVEGALVGGTGGAAGLAAGAGLLALVAPLLPAEASVPGRLLLDLRVGVFTLAVTSLTGVLASAYAALQAGRGSAADPLRASTRSSAGRSTRRIRHGLMIGELALAVLLLVGAGQAVRGFVRLLAVDPGIEIGGVATARVSPSPARYPGATEVLGFYGRLLAELDRAPGVEHAGAVSILPLSGDESDWAFGVEGFTPSFPGETPDEQGRLVAGDYFQSLGIPLVAGRFFDGRDTADGPPVVIVNASLARKYWGGAGAVGRRIKLWGLDAADQPWRTVVGVVGDIRHRVLSDPPVPILYYPNAQFPDRTLTVVVRASGEAAAGARLIEDTVRRLDPEQPVFAVRTMRDYVARSTVEPRFSLVLLGVFATAAVLLAAVGVYGVMAYAVGRRTREFAIRLALGAQPGWLLARVLGQCLSLVGLAVALGLLGALAAARRMASLFYGAAAFDPVLLGGAALGLGMVALAACWAPARRAMRIEPTEALRQE